MVKRKIFRIDKVRDEIEFVSDDIYIYIYISLYTWVLYARDRPLGRNRESERFFSLSRLRPPLRRVLHIPPPPP
jgi:hypothetical protein